MFTYKVPGLSTSTKERIVDEAMRLFAERGYKGTSITQIEEASGLSPGAGGLYRHFSSKDELLAAGIRRHLERLEALRDVRGVFNYFGDDLPSELAAVGRYFLTELDSQSELFRILVSERLQRPALLEQAVDDLISSTYHGFAEWLRQIATLKLTRQRAETVSVLALGSLLSSRLLKNVMRSESVAIDDERLISAWVEMITFLLEA